MIIIPRKKQIDIIMQALHPELADSIKRKGYGFEGGEIMKALLGDSPSVEGIEDLE